MHLASSDAAPHAILMMAVRRRFADTKHPVGADDPVRPKAPVCKGPRSGGTGVNDMPRLGMPAGICRRRRLRDCRAGSAHPYEFDRTSGK